jgi:TolB-like protein/Tfp pilus assembly protein PilF
MPSILPGYNYDIFISYRHKDNKYDGWVTEFVQNLKKELDATFKDDISIYFDFNTDDGLLESHNVDKTLEGKLNCLILIPILSQTYCDPRSFAWEHEFRAFNKLAKGDMFGRDIKLRNGNVASRILPVRVRELDEEDKKLLEDELGSVLRPIDFIYKEQGVNRPLKPEDSEEKNLNHTKYRNQINKTANAIKEIVTALKWKHSGAPEPAHVQPEAEETPVKATRQKKRTSPVVQIIRVAFGLAVAAYFIFGGYRKSNGTISDSDDDEVVERSIAVLPFEDLSSGHDQEYFSDGIAEEILNSLAHIPGLKVAGRTSSFQFKGQKTDLKDVGEKLNVATVLEGSVRKAGNRVRITAQLIGVKDGYHIWSETYDRDMTDIFAIQDEVANKIAQVLLKELAVTTNKTKSERTENVKAYEYYLEGKYINLHQFIWNGKLEDFLRAESLFKKALQLDSNYALAHAGLADLYNSYTNRVKKDPKYMELQQKEIDIAYKLNPNLDYVCNTLGHVSSTKGDYDKSFENFARAVELNPNDAYNLAGLSTIALRLGLLDQALPVMDRAIRLEPLETINFLTRGSIYFQLSRFDDALKDLKKALELEPSNYGAIVQVSYLYLIKKEMALCKVYMDKADSIRPNLRELTSLHASYEARLGNREKALSMKPDFRTYLILGMNKEGVELALQAFSQIKPPLNIYLSISKSPLLEKMGNDPRFMTWLKKEKEGYESNKAKYQFPVLPN